MTHDELANDLARHLFGDGTERMVWTNMQMGPAGSPRPDVMAIDKSFSKFRVNTYEVKVSVADLRRDLTAGKWQTYLPFSHAVWFAMPRGLAPIDMIPKACGVILRSDSGWRAARRPVLQPIANLPRDAWVKLLLEYDRRMTMSRPEPRRLHEWTVHEQLRKKYGGTVATLLSRRSNAQHHFEIVTAELESATQTMQERIEELRVEARKQAECEAHYLNDEIQRLGHALGMTGQFGARELNARLRAVSKAMHCGSLKYVVSQLRDGALLREMEALVNLVDTLSATQVTEP